MASRGNGGRRQLQLDTTATDSFNNDSSSNSNTAMSVTAGSSSGSCSASPTSSQGSWVVDPDEGWDGQRALPVAVPPSPEASRQQQQRRLSPASSSLRGWAQVPVPVSPPAAEYPAMMTGIHSPPQSPGSVRSVSSAGSGGSSSSARAAAGEGLVALARDQNQNQNQNSDESARPLAGVSVNANLMDTEVARSSSSSSSSSSWRAPAAGGGGGIVPRSLPFETIEALETQGFDQGSGSGGGAWACGPTARAGAGAGVGCTAVGDVNAIEMEMEIDVADLGHANPAGEHEHEHEHEHEYEHEHEHEHAFVMRAAPGMTAAEAVEAIAEAAELRGITPTSVVLSQTQVSPSRMSLSQEGKEDEGLGLGHARPQQGEIMFRHGRTHSPAASYRSTTLSRNSSSSSARAAAAAAAAAAGGVAGVPDVDVVGSRVSPGSAGASACIPMDATVGIDVDDIDVDVDVDVDGRYDGKQMDRLWRWTGLITAAKMGVIPIIVCATVAALSTQTGGGGGDRGEGRGGGGGGGRGGGGGTRCFSRRRPRGGGGGGGGGCFPDARIDRCGMPIPYCVAPSVACA